jgi:hypothetical protein
VNQDLTKVSLAQCNRCYNDSDVKSYQNWNIFEEESPVVA